METEMLFIETKHHKDGLVLAKLTKAIERPEEESTNDCEHYILYIKDANQPNELDDEYDPTLQEWIEENLVVEPNDIADLILKLEDGEWIDISKITIF